MRVPLLWRGSWTVHCFDNLEKREERMNCFAGRSSLHTCDGHNLELAPLKVPFILPIDSEQLAPSNGDHLCAHAMIHGLGIGSLPSSPSKTPLLQLLPLPLQPPLILLHQRIPKPHTPRKPAQMRNVIHNLPSPHNPQRLHRC